MARLWLSVAILLLLPSLALADQAGDAAACQHDAGAFLAGTVIRAPTFRSGQKLHGVYLSHTHLTLRSDEGGSYDVAIDNVFANGYRKNQPSVPAPLNTIHVGDRLELCGQLYTSGGTGIHWVHTNCGVSPTSNRPNGWVRKVGGDGNTGDNMEANQAFCRLFPE